MVLGTSTPQLPIKIPQIPSNRDYKAPNRGTLEGLGRYLIVGCLDPIGLWFLFWCMGHVFGSLDPNEP